MTRMKTTLYSPQLERDVELHILLPDRYAKSQKRYPVLYFYDGDRVYDAPPAPDGPSAFRPADSFEFGAYQRAYRQFLPEIILVGIAPPAHMWKRTAEYSPYSKDFDVPEGVNFEAHIRGKGEALGRWVVDTLKPWVDQNYRTRPEQDYTAIGGLSTSGVNALYMITAYPQVFSRCLLHAPAVHLWIDKVLETISRGSYDHIKYAYFDIGTEDCTRMVKKGEAYRDLQTILEILEQNGMTKSGLRFFEIYQGTHECSTWRLTFPDGLRWIFQDITPGE